MEARRAGARVVQAAVDAAVAAPTAARVSVARLDRAPASVQARRRPARVGELTRVAEVRRVADALEPVGGHVDARAAVLTVGTDARAGRLASLAVVPLGTHASVNVVHLILFFFSIVYYYALVIVGSYCYLEPAKPSPKILLRLTYCDLRIK